MAMRFRAHETFFIRKGWISKGMRCVEQDPEVFISREKKPMDILGIGSNMVKSLRFWLPVIGVTEEKQKGKRTQEFTELGRLVYDNDRYAEEFGTLLLLHYNLVCSEEEATAWYFFFNEFNMSEFTKEEFVSQLQAYVLRSGEEPAAIRSLNDDFNCIIGTYVPRYKTSPGRISPENNIDCPFGELGLVDIVNRSKKVYRKAMPRVSNIDPWVLLAVIMDNAGGRKEIGLNELLTAHKNIGRVFNLDVIGMIDALHIAEKTGVIKIIRTAGLDIIRINEQHTFLECVGRYYQNIGRR